MLLFPVSSLSFILSFFLSTTLMRHFNVLLGVISLQRCEICLSCLSLRNRSQSDWYDTELPHAACCIIHPSAGRTCGFCVSLNSHHKDNMAVKAIEEQAQSCVSGGLCRSAVGKCCRIPRVSAGEHLGESWVCWTDRVWSQACSALYRKWLPLFNSH